MYVLVKQGQITKLVYLRRPLAIVTVFFLQRSVQSLSQSKPCVVIASVGTLLITYGIIFHCNIQCNVTASPFFTHYGRLSQNTLPLLT